MEYLLQKYRDRLTDLSKRNSSLRLFRLYNKNHFDMTRFAKLGETNCSHMEQAVFALKAQVILMSTLTTTDEGGLANRQLTTLKREVELIEQETGMNTFHVAYGFLEGILVDDFYIRSPLLFYPAKLLKKLHHGVLHWALQLDEENPPFFNPTLLLAFRRYLGLDLIEQIRSDAFVIPSTNPLEYVQNKLVEAGLNIINQPEVGAVAYPEVHQGEVPSASNGFTIAPYMVMGKFRQSTSTLLHDYDELLEHPPKTGLLHRLLNETPSDDQLGEIRPELLETVAEHVTFFVLETDASQEAAIVAARNRDGLIVHGPPGTGKSQVIVNLIADRLALGQRVLLVCQKPVALEVVYHRLTSIGLHQHVARVYDVNGDKAAVYAQLGRVLTRDVTETATSFERISNDMNGLAAKLDGFANSLHRRRWFGQSLYYLYARAVWDTDLLMDVSATVAELTVVELEHRMANLRVLLTLKEQFDHPTHPWCQRNSFAGLGIRQHVAVEELLSKLVDGAKQAKLLMDGIEWAYPLAYFLRNRPALAALTEALKRLETDDLYDHVQRFFASKANPIDNVKRIHQLEQFHTDLVRRLGVVQVATPAVEGMDLAQATLWTGKLDKFFAMQQTMTRFCNVAWYRLKRELRKHCQINQVAFEPEAMHQYRSAIETLLQIERMRMDASPLHFYADAPAKNVVAEWTKWLQHKQHGIEFLQLYVEAQTVFGDWLQDITTRSAWAEYVNSAFVDNVHKIVRFTERTEQLLLLLTELSTYVAPAVIDVFLSQMNHGEYPLSTFQAMLETVSNFDALVRLDQLKENLDETSRHWLVMCEHKAPIATMPRIADKWLKLIENSCYHAWIEKIEHDEPYLSDVSTGIYAQARNLYTKLLLEKRKAVPGHIDAQLAQAAMTVQPGTRLKLKSEVDKKRRLKPLRQIIGSFTEDVLTLLPCWLCTPDAVSAIFPASAGLFDLVIFDEASQCPVENAIPAIFRGKQVVVAGDEKQLPPTQLFRISDEIMSEEDEATGADTDTSDVQATHLLEWGRSRMADQWLTWHYRSTHDALINFSNYAFYGKRMQTAPVVNHGAEPPIKFIQVEGKWSKQQNRVEAEKIVDFVVQILRDKATPTLGIITFNAAQAELINDVLDERANTDSEVRWLIDAARQRYEGAQYVGLFVKNIENVQGDERDIILFSVAYAKNELGILPSQFGSLSRDLGENRLNVAITRARQKEYIICSFEPAKWTRVDTYTSRGPRLLKKYLEYGQAVSDRDSRRVQEILDSLLDTTALQDIANESIYDSPFEAEVADRIRQLGYVVHTQVGCSGYRIDLAIVDPQNPERYILAIECDGATYHSSKIARERDFYRQRFLEQHGWKVYRIWSRNWWKAPQQEQMKIQQLVEGLTQKNLVGVLNHS